MPKCDFNKVASNFIKITLRHGCSPVNLLHIFRTPYPWNTSGWLLLISFRVNLESCILKIIQGKLSVSTAFLAKYFIEIK